MKVIIAGSRGINDYSIVCKAIEQSKFKITELVSGGAVGVDNLGERWAREHDVLIKKFIPHWYKYGKAAGPMRNKEMGEYADALIAIWDGRSRGTAHMIATARGKGLRVFLYKAAGGGASSAA